MSDLSDAMPMRELLRLAERLGCHCQPGYGPLVKVFPPAYAQQRMLQVNKTCDDHGAKRPLIKLLRAVERAQSGISGGG